MKVIKLSSEKGNYSEEKAKGHLDTQIFPESVNTKFDRNVVKKEQKKKNTKEAARPRLDQGVEEAFGTNTGFDTGSWDSIYKKAKEIYTQLKSFNDPSVMDDNAVKNNIKSKLIQELNVEESMANLAALTVLNSDSKWRKQQKTTQTKTAQENPYRYLKNPFRQDDLKDIPPKQPKETIEQVHVIYPDVEENGSKSRYKEFDVRVPAKEGDSNQKIADGAWAILDHPDSTVGIELGVRSPMVGDVFIVKDVPYVALGVGFAEISQTDLEKWKNIPSRNKLMAFKEDELREMLVKAFSNKTIRQADKCENCQIKA